MTKEARIYNGEKIVSSISGAGKISINSDMQMTPPLWQKEKKN